MVFGAPPRFTAYTLENAALQGSIYYQGSPVLAIITHFVRHQPVDPRNASVEVAACICTVPVADGGAGYLVTDSFHSAVVRGLHWEAAYRYQAC